MAFPKPNDGTQGNIGRTVTTGQAPGGTMKDPASEICSQCGVPHSACPGHYSDAAANPPAATPASFMPTPFALDDK